MRHHYRSALIVGAGDGLSASVARAFAGAGMRVGLAARNPDKLASLASELKAEAFACDASKPAEVDAMFKAADAALGGSPVTIHLVVTDVDKQFQRAIDAGATVVHPLEDQFWGDRYGVLQDPFGHQWSMGQPVREVSMEEIQEAMKQH